MNPPARFDEAWTKAIDHAERAVGSGCDVVLVRDLMGRVSVIVDDRTAATSEQTAFLASLREEFVRDTHPFTGLDPVQLASEMFAPEILLDSPDIAIRSEADPESNTGRLGLLDRTVVGADWLRTPQVENPNVRQRVALYGFKGGVGRSTATTVLARRLADLGRCVLVVDLDLESPGVSALLEDPAGLPDHGIVDHLVEDAVGNADDLELICRSSVLPMSGNGEVWLASAGGRPREGYDFLAKLNRIYSDLPPATPGGEPRPFARRLDAAISACEQQVAKKSRQPDIVLLDSRAGVHDIAAVTLTQLCQMALLFAVDNPATWHGYGMLVNQWNQRPDQARALRERLRIVAAMLPQTDWEERLETVSSNALDVLSALYDDAAKGDRDAFNPSLQDEGAPHAAIPIFFSNELVSLDPASNRDWIDLPLIKSAYELFLEKVERIIPDPLPESR
ncbi:P-loop NTPase [Kitasatospora sp. NPDC004799]|uniref:KGGVGR-motif variant AAA ATPase n=1 Tax=Kitasatospora sp. NPDC004799 TaxID=3154460 RepID=UPI0033B1BB93